MLSDADRTELRKIEQRLASQDAAFVRVLRQGSAQLPAEPLPPADLRPLRDAAWSLAGALVLLLLAAGSLVGALLMCLLTLAAHRCWTSPRHGAPSRAGVMQTPRDRRTP